MHIMPIITLQNEIAKGDFIRMKEISLSYDFPNHGLHQQRYPIYL